MIKKLLIFCAFILSINSVNAQRINTSPETNQSIDYAWLLSGKDMNFILTIEAESRWDIKAIGDGGKSFGLCQVNVRWHKLPKDYLTSTKVQIDHCWKLYSGYKSQGILHKRLFGYNVRMRYSHLYR